MRIFAILIAISAVASASAVFVPATSASSFVSLGTYSNGTVLNLSASGIASLGDAYEVYADGSLVSPVSGTYAYANAGSSGNPTLFGGDGINHFAGGGINFDAYAYSIGYTDEFSFGLGGKKTTDTTDGDTIRLGAIIGTFSAAPTRADWFLIGTGTSIVSNGSELRVAVNESYWYNDTGGFELSVQAVPEPATFAVLGVGALALLRRRRS